MGAVDSGACCIVPDRCANALQNRVRGRGDRREPVARGEAQAGLRHPAPPSARRGGHRRGRLLPPGRRRGGVSGPLVGGYRRDPPRLLFLQQAAHLQGSRHRVLARERGALQSRDHPCAVRQAGLQGTGLDDHRRRPSRRAPRRLGHAPGRGRRQLSDARRHRRQERPQPGHPGSPGHRQVADDHESDRRSDRGRQEGPVRRRENGGARGRQAAPGRHPHR